MLDLIQRRTEQTMGSGGVSEQDLVAKLNKPDWAEALGELWQQNLGLLWNTARAVTNSDDDAADAISDAFTQLAVRASAGKLVVRASFRALATTAVRNCAISRYRKVQREYLIDEPLESSTWDESQLPLGRLVSSVDTQMVAEAFASLPERSRLVLWLTEVENLPPREISLILGISPNLVSQIATRSRSSLQTAWISQHLPVGTQPKSCVTARELLPSEMSATISAASLKKLEAHLRDCHDCSEVRIQLREDSLALRGLVVPVSVGLAGGAAWWISQAKAASAATLISSSTASDPQGSDEPVHSGGSIDPDSESNSMSSLRPVALLVGSALVILALGALMLGIRDSDSSVAEINAPLDNSAVVDEVTAPQGQTAIGQPDPTDALGTPIEGSAQAVMPTSETTQPTAPSAPLPTPPTVPQPANVYSPPTSLIITGSNCWWDSQTLNAGTVSFNYSYVAVGGSGYTVMTASNRVGSFGYQGGGKAYFVSHPFAISADLSVDDPFQIKRLDTGDLVSVNGLIPISVVNGTWDPTLCAGYTP